MRAKSYWLIAGLAVILTSTHARGQEAAPQSAPTPAPARAEAPAPSGLKTGPAAVAPHWSKNDYPRSIPEGAPFHIVERNDTLWDLAKRYLANAYLWPQLWHENAYIKDAHWIYPGDPVLFPRLQVVAAQAGGVGGELLPGAGVGEYGEALPAEESGQVGIAVSPGGRRLAPLLEQTAAQCSPYIPDGDEDQGLKVLGSEDGTTRITMATGEVLYFNRGTDAGIKPGDVFSIHRVLNTVVHPRSSRTIGKKVLTVGWARVILAEAKASSAVIEQACQDVRGGDYAKPFKPVPVPMIPVTRPSTRLTPHSDKASGYVIDLQDVNDIAATGEFAIINLGSDEGLAPGTLLQVFRIEYPTVPTPRRVIADLAVVTVQERTATTRIIHSATAVMVGDLIEVR